VQLTQSKHALCCVRTVLLPQLQLPDWCKAVAKEQRERNWKVLHSAKTDQEKLDLQFHWEEFHVQKSLGNWLQYNKNKGKWQLFSDVRAGVWHAWDCVGQATTGVIAIDSVYQLPAGRFPVKTVVTSTLL
jgi:hypothetical protein